LWLLAALIPLFAGVGRAQAIKNVLQPSDHIAASSLNSPATEGVANAIDGTEAKYLNFDGATGPCGFVVTPQVGATLVSGLGMQTANDSGPGNGDRDPSIVTIEGSNDTGAGYNSNTTWTLIYSNTVPLITNRYQFVYFYFANYQAFTSYRWTAVKCAGPGQNSMQIAEVQLLGTAVPLNVLQPSDPIVASSLNSPATEGVANAIDGTEAKYLNFDGATGPCGFVVTPQVGATVALGLGMQTANDSGPGNGDRDPSIVTVEGSNDTGASYNTNTTWTLIFSNSVPLITNRYQFVHYYFPNATPYKSYRWTAVKCAGPGQNSMQIAEVQILGVSAPVNVLQPSDPIAASSLNSPATEGVANAIDGTEAKYLNFDGATGPCGFVVTPKSGATTITGLGMQTANDSGPGNGDRDPSIVTIEGSNDTGAGYNTNTTWTLIFSNSVPLITNRYQYVYYYFPNNIAYTSYRWTAVKCAGPGQNSMQIAEVQLLAITTKADCTKAAFVSQPSDTPVLPGDQAQLLTTVNGPWPIQWMTNGVSVPGATKPTFTTDPITTANAGIAYSVAIVGCQTSSPVHAIIFTPSTTESIGIQFAGGGANGAPSYILTNDIAGVQQQAYFNVATNGSGSTGDGTTLPDTLLDSSNNASSITFTFQTSGTWGAGVGTAQPTQRMLNGTVGGNGGTPLVDEIFTFGNVPAGKHAILIYAIEPPTHRQRASYSITNAPAQTTYMRVMASEEYNAVPGFYRSTSTTATSPSVGDFVRFDGVSPDVNSNITLVVDVLDSADGHPGGVNALQLVLNAPNPGSPPVITQDLVPTVGPAGGSVSLSVVATGNNLTYQWRKNGVPLQNGGDISGATTSKLTINPLNPADVAVYSVVVFSPAGSTVSANASVRISTYNIQDSLVGYWKFDETSGTNALDSATNGTADVAEIFSVAPTWVAGKVGNAYSFDGNTWMFVTNFPKASAGIAASAWVNLNGAPPGGSEIIIQNAQPNLNINGGGARITGSFEFTLAFDGASGNMYPEGGVGIGANIATVIGTTPVPSSGWHHVAFTADGAQVRLYVDGQQSGVVGYSGTIDTPDIPYLSIGARLNADTNSPVGVSPDANGEFNTGLMDELALWTRALSADEITALYTAGNGGKALTTIVLTPPATGGGTLKASVAAGKITVTWTSGTLQSATSITGPWANVTGATGGSFTEAVAAGAKFYRTH